jgi:hypothetical protein
MKKHLQSLALSATLGLALLGPVTLAHAEDHEHHGPSFSQADKAAFLDAKIAALKAGLKLTPAQEKNWPAVETAIRAYDKAKQDQMDAWRKSAHEGHQHDDLIEHLHKKAQFLAAYSAETNKLADAVKPLYDSLDDAQNHRLAFLLHVVKHGPGGHHGWGPQGDDGPDAQKPNDDHDGK